jgi:hypothetical protein
LATTCTARRGRKNGDGEQAKHGKREGKNTESKATTRRRKAKDEQEIRRRINGVEGRERKTFRKHVLEEKER